VDIIGSEARSFRYLFVPVQRNLELVGILTYNDAGSVTLQLLPLNLWHLSAVGSLGPTT